MFAKSGFTTAGLYRERIANVKQKNVTEIKKMKFYSQSKHFPRVNAGAKGRRFFMTCMLLKDASDGGGCILQGGNDGGFLFGTAQAELRHGEANRC